MTKTSEQLYFRELLQFGEAERKPELTQTCWVSSTEATLGLSSKLNNRSCKTKLFQEPRKHVYLHTYICDTCIFMCVFCTPMYIYIYTYEYSTDTQFLNLNLLARSCLNTAQTPNSLDLNLLAQVPFGGQVWMQHRHPTL